MLAERGALDIGRPVAHYIPEYGAHGKGEITIGHVLAHRAGVPNLPPDAFDLDRAADREFLVRMFCEARPIAKPGRLLAYHAVSGGYILGEVVYRVTGKDIRTVLAEEILGPLGFRWNNYGVASGDVDQVALNYLTGPPTVPPLSNLFTRALGLPLDELVEAVQRSPVPGRDRPLGQCRHAPAEELSRFYEIFGAAASSTGCGSCGRDRSQRAAASSPISRSTSRSAFPPASATGSCWGRSCSACSAATPSTPSATSASPTCSRGLTRSAPWRAR